MDPVSDIHTRLARRLAFRLCRPRSLDARCIGEPEGGLSKILDDSRQAVPSTTAPALVAFFPEARLARGATQALGSRWEASELFRWKNRVYVLDQTSDWSRDAPVPVTVYRLRADGAIERKCAIDIRDRGQRVEAALKSSGLLRLLGSLSHVAGGGSYCGQLDSQGMHLGEAVAASHSAVLRPWTVGRYDRERYGSAKYFVYDQRFVSFLNDWSLGNAWNRIVYLELQQHMTRTAGVYAVRLEREFGLSSQAAVARARSVIEGLVAAWVQVPNAYQPGVDLYSLHQPPMALALLKRDEAALEDSLDDREQILAAAPSYAQREPPVSVLASHMHDAVIWPKGLEALLRVGANVDSKNMFWKTPLMSAAHMNRPDAVRTLLRQKADVNARTTSSYEECGYSFLRGERTALMYAAENAGIEVIQLLLGAGADPSAKDSKGNGVEFYLARNPRFGHLPKFDIAELAKQPPPADVPSFRCDGRLSEVERQICGDEALRLYDREIAAAYTRLLKSSATIKSDQRAWLKESVAACEAYAGEAKTGCLQDLLLARARYLHALLNGD